MRFLLVYPLIKSIEKRDDGEEDENGNGNGLA